MFDNPERIKPGLTIQDLAEVAVKSERQYKEMFIAAKRERDKLRVQVEELESRHKLPHRVGGWGISERCDEAHFVISG